MRLAWIDWLIILAYVAFAIGVGIRFARRAGQSVDEYFLSGRSLPWWIAGTSMVATSFAADTPLLITGWVRDDGIWRNWVWWCYAASGMLQVFLFARWWRRAGVMTKAELVELRYGGRGAALLRGFLGTMHAGVTNTLVLCWVLLAAAKISEVLFEVDKLTGLTVACTVALTYSLLAGFWGVVMTDLVQFVIAMVGAIALAAISWQAVGGNVGIQAAVDAGKIAGSSLDLLPSASSGSFWTAPVAAIAVYLGVSWWAVENVDGSGAAVQRIAAARDERQGVLAVLWFNVSHYALRPWCWILVALASLVLLPTVEVFAPDDLALESRVLAVDDEQLVLGTDRPGEERTLDVVAGHDADWHPLPVVSVGDRVAAGELVARTDSERAYVVMMARFLPVGLLGLVAASLLAAFMSTIDTHVNLASSFFVNDVYRRFIVRAAEPRHYVRAARAASVVALGIAALMAWRATSVRQLFIFFLAFLGGVGPVYVMRWLWWRVRASTEISAMLTSAVTSTVLTFVDVEWRLGPLSPGGELADVGRIVLVVLASLTCALLSMAVTRRPDPRSLVAFYAKARPLGWWGPVRELTPEAGEREEAGPALFGALAALALTYGLLLGLGFLFLGRQTGLAVSAVVTLAGTAGVVWALRRMFPRADRSEPRPGP